MPITYDPGTNTITVIGFSEASPCTFEDIYNASVTNGWGVVEKPTDDTYVIRAKIQIGDGTTWTYFADREKTVIFTSDVVLDYHERAIYVTRHAYFWIGEGDESTRTGHRGCVFDGRDMTLNSRCGFVDADSESDVRLYGCVFIAGRYETLIAVINLKGDVARVWDCYVEGGGTGVYPTPNLDMNSTTILDCSFGIGYGYQPAYPFTNIVVMYSNSAGVYFYSTQAYNLFNTRFAKNHVAIHTFDLRTAARLTDCEADEWTMNWGGSPTEDAKIERAYTFKVKVTDKDGNPIENALVELYDKNDNLVFAELTDSNGEISEHSIVSITYTPTGTIDNNPYTVKITKSGYTPLEVKITIDRTMKNLIWQLDALDYTLDDIYTFLKGGYGILNRETLHKTGSAIKVRFKSKSGDTCKVYVYKPDGTEVVSGAGMTEMGTTGIYYYDLTLNSDWGTGEFLIKCVDEDEGIEDSITITVLSENGYFATQGDLKRHDIKMTGLKFV